LVAKQDIVACREEIEETEMPRVAFRLRIKAGRETEYDVAHRNVWPVLLTKVKEVGISNYSIYRREQDLFLVMQIDNFDAAWRALDEDPSNQRWQKEMALLFEPVPGVKLGEKVCDDGGSVLFSVSPALYYFLEAILWDDSLMRLMQFSLCVTASGASSPIS